MPVVLKKAGVHALVSRQAAVCAGGGGTQDVCALPAGDAHVFDHRGLGDAFPQFLSQPWIDEKGKEYPPWTPDDEKTTIHTAVPMLRSVKANAQINQQLVSCLRVA